MRKENLRKSHRGIWLLREQLMRRLNPLNAVIICFFIFCVAIEYRWIRSHERALGWQYLSGKGIIVLFPFFNIFFSSEPKSIDCLRIWIPITSQSISRVCEPDPNKKFIIQIFLLKDLSPEHGTYSRWYLSHFTGV